MSARAAGAGGRPVLLAHAHGDGALAEKVAGPLRVAGYEVVYEGTVLVGESLVQQASAALGAGSPVVLCGTIQAMGTGWAHQAVNAARAAYPGVRVFALQMEKHAYLQPLTLDGKVALYWQDPGKAISDVLAALQEHYPPPADLVSAADAQMYSTTSALGGHVRMQYLDRLAPEVPFSQEKTSEFRRRLRPDIAAEIPPQLNASEFLQRAGLLRNGKLSYAGVLLFGNSNPSIIIPSALVQCVRFYGNSPSAHLETIEIHDTVPETIVRAWDFVADACRLGEIPTSQSPYAEPMYKYPMIAVRELIANAIVHRDYEVRDACTQIFIFENRLEVISPGGWGDSSANTTAGQVELGELQRQSRKRNFRLAHTLTWSRLVEGVGAGIPRAIEDCARMGSPEPTVLADERMVTVTIYPRAAFLDRRHKHTKVPVIESSPARLVAINSRNPLFFLSYSYVGAHSRRLESQFIKFFEDLSVNVAELVNLPPGEAAGYMATAEPPDDDHWTDERLAALGACQVFVPLLSHRYFASPYCLEEWRLFAEREVIEHGETEAGNVTASTGILPIFWTGSISYSRAPEMISKVKAFQPTSDPDRNFSELYRKEGIVGLLQMGLDAEYQKVIWRIAQRIEVLYDSQYRARSLLRDPVSDEMRDIPGPQG